MVSIKDLSKPIPDPDDNGVIRDPSNDGDYGTWLGRVKDCKIKPVTKHDFFEIVNFATRMNLSDLVIQTGKPIFVNHHGELTAITRPLGRNEVQEIMLWCTNREKITFDLESGQDYDTAFTVPDLKERDKWGRPRQHRFRLNITACSYDGGIGYQLVSRYISPKIPTVASVRLEPEIVREATPSQGGVVLLGEVGSGKTSTAAALMTEVAAGRTPIRGSVLTYESPIEFDYEALPSAHVIFSQSDIPINLPSFSRGSRNSVRRKPALVNLGELRDRDTIEAATEMMTTGVICISTAHANCVAVGFRRLVQKFPENLQAQAFYGLVANIHMLVNQRLVRHKDWTWENPKMICLREWQVMTDEVRSQIEAAGPERHGRVLQSILCAPNNQHGQSMLVTVRKFFRAGEITEDVAHRVLIAYGYHTSALTSDDEYMPVVIEE